MLLGGEAALFVERGGRTLVLPRSRSRLARLALAALVEHVRGRAHVKRLAIERFDGEPVGETDVMPLLVEVALGGGPRRAVLRPSPPETGGPAARRTACRTVALAEGAAFVSSGGMPGSPRAGW